MAISRVDQIRIVGARKGVVLRDGGRLGTGAWDRASTDFLETASAGVDTDVTCAKNLSCVFYMYKKKVLRKIEGTG